MAFGEVLVADSNSFGHSLTQMLHLLTDVVGFLIKGSCKVYVRFLSLLPEGRIFLESKDKAEFEAS